MAWLCKDRDGSEWIYEKCPVQSSSCIDEWVNNIEDFGSPSKKLPTGSIAKLIGRELTWEDEPVKIGFL